MLRVQRFFNSFSSRQGRVGAGVATTMGASSSAGLVTAATTTAEATAVTQPQQPPPLLLEGDEFCVSSDGIARSFYELVPSAPHEIPPIAIEELYNLKTAHKTFFLRQEVPEQAHHHHGLHLPHMLHPNKQPEKEKKAPLGPKLASLELQEINHGITAGGPGTGSTTWESSIAMALYFSAHPDLCHGKVLELGSGVGLGGILSNMGPRLNDHYEVNSIRSITMTDVNDDVLRQCKQNVQLAFGLVPQHPAVNVSKLDWNELSKPRNIGSYHERYDTVIACDCAYKVEDVASLSNSLKALVHEDPKCKIHMFGPHNRAAFQEVIRYMIDELNMDVALDLIEVNRFRLKPGVQHGWFHVQQHQRYATEEECAYASKTVARFMHVTASHQPKGDKRFQDQTSID